MSGNAWLHQLERDMPYKSQNSARAIMIDRWFCLGKISQFFVLLSLNAAGWIYSTQTMTAPAWKYQGWHSVAENKRRIFRASDGPTALSPCVLPMPVFNKHQSTCLFILFLLCSSTLQEYIFFARPMRPARSGCFFFLTLRSLRLGLRWHFMCLGSDLDRDVPGQGSMS